MSRRVTANPAARAAAHHARSDRPLAVRSRAQVKIRTFHPVMPLSAADIEEIAKAVSNKMKPVVRTIVQEELDGHEFPGTGEEGISDLVDKVNANVAATNALRTDVGKLVKASGGGGSGSGGGGKDRHHLRDCGLEVTDADWCAPPGASPCARGRHSHLSRAAAEG